MSREDDEFAWNSTLFDDYLQQTDDELRLATASLAMVHQMTDDLTQQVLDDS